MNSFKQPPPNPVAAVGNQGDMIAVTRLLTVSEISRWLAVSPSWIRDHASGRRRPPLPCIKLGKSLRFDSKAVNGWLNLLRTSGTAA
ncbi:MAG: helix-turn-helix domain-containing protein [Acidobacteriia bacterium]|nr:helix-turn-helix domain-containing protein [Terriglobia bacterium]